MMNWDINLDKLALAGITTLAASGLLEQLWSRVKNGIMNDSEHISKEDRIRRAKRKRYKIRFEPMNEIRTR